MYQLKNMFTFVRSDQSNSFNNRLCISLEEYVESPFQVKGSKNTYSILDFVELIALLTFSSHSTTILQKEKDLFR